MKGSECPVIAVPACMGQMHLIIMGSPLTEWVVLMLIGSKIICFT